MDRPKAATSLARALLSLARARATGVLGIRARGRSGDIAIEDGVPRAIALEGEHDPCLGDWLVREGALDPRRHLEAMEQGGPRGPVGAWLVASGATTEDALEGAVSAQLRHRLGLLFRWEGVDLCFRGGSSWVGVARPNAEARPGLPAAALVVEAMRATVADEPLLVVRKRLGDGVLKLTDLGRELVEGAVLLPEEQAMIGLLERGSPVDALLSAGGGTSVALRGLFALRLIGAATAPSPGGQAYRLLLRKRRQIRMAADARSLLELPQGYRPDQARRALRRLARDVHPDRFSDGAHPALREASAEVLTALVAAEAHLRGR
jgi:hypothetical protein